LILHHILVCKDNKVNYTAITTFNNCVNYFDKTYKNVTKYSYTASSTKGVISNKALVIDGSYIDHQTLFVHMYGTITCLDTVNMPSMYHYQDNGPRYDHVLILPANYYNNVSNIDFWYINCYDTNVNNFIWMIIKPCDCNYNVIQTPIKVKINIDVYV